MSAGKIIRFEGKSFKLVEMEKECDSCTGCYFAKEKERNGFECSDFNELDCISGIFENEAIFVRYIPEIYKKKKLRI